MDGLALMPCAPPVSTSPQDRQRGGNSCFWEGWPRKLHSQEPQAAQGDQQDGASEEDWAQAGRPGPADEPHITDLLLHPISEVGGAGVDTRKVALVAAKAPAHHPHLNPGVVHLADQRIARVTLWRGVRAA